MVGVHRATGATTAKPIWLWIVQAIFGLCALLMGYFTVIALQQRQSFPAGIGVDVDDVTGREAIPFRDPGRETTHAVARHF